MTIDKHGVKIVFVYCERLHMWVLECSGTTTVQEMPYTVNTCETFSCFKIATKELKDAIATYH